MGLISRQAAIDVLEERLRANGYTNVALVSELNRSIGYLMRLPSAEAEPVVRCKDCKHYNLFNNGCNGMCCIHIDAFEVFYPNDYCSYGERKPDETD